MSLSHSNREVIHDSQISDRPRAPDVVPTLFDLGELYLTDEVFLFRVLGVVDTDAGEMVELEDSYALHVVRVAIDDPRLLGLRVVMPTPACG